MSEEFKDDGGSAFPTPGITGITDGEIILSHASDGMTLRDYFAAAALKSFNGRYSGQSAAIEAYQIADFMLMERVKN